jgi:hypothetical protein
VSAIITDLGHLSGLLAYGVVAALGVRTERTPAHPATVAHLAGSP